MRPRHAPGANRHAVNEQGDLTATTDPAAGVGELDSDLVLTCGEQ